MENVREMESMEKKRHKAGISSEVQTLRMNAVVMQRLKRAAQEMRIQRSV